MVFIPKNSFSQNSYDNYSFKDKEIDSVIKNQKNQSKGQQIAGFFILPIDVQKLIFDYLSVKNLRTCLKVCKQFNFISFSILSNTISISYADFYSLERKLNENFAKLSSSKDSNNRVDDEHISFLNSNLKNLSSIKSYFVHLANVTIDMDELPKVRTILKSIMALEQACKATLKTNIKIKIQQLQLLSQVNKNLGYKK